MRILFINQVFYPDTAATAQHAHDLLRHLVNQGHEVDVIASRSLYGEKGANLAKRETVDGGEVYRVGRSWFGKGSIIARVIDFGLFYVAAMFKALTVRRPDVVVCFTTPPFIALVGWMMRVLRGSKYVYWVMDLYPDLPVACGVMKPDSLGTRFFERVNRFCLRKADAVVVLGRCMRDRVLSKGIPPELIHHIGVWSDQDEVKPIAREDNPYRATWDLGDRFVIMYSGNFGLGHDVETMCEATKRLADDDRFRFVYVGGGKKKSIVEAYITEHGLQNTVVAGYQPRENLDQSLSCADVHLASLLEGVEGIMVPCKLFGIMAAGRPTLFIGHPDSELARVLEEHQAGFCIRQGDVDGLVKRIVALADDPEGTQAMGDRAREALKVAYGRHQACEAWQMLLESLVESSKRAE
ncbi:MAG: glycosyltransferase family 4 protein [Phycisphaerales bacterium]|nr:glycosyltransferase family 4 protein [Phycisphaerales bacterium]